MVIFFGKISLLGWALIFLIFALVASAFGFERIAGFSFLIARLFAMIFVFLLVLVLVLHLIYKI